MRWRVPPSGVGSGAWARKRIDALRKQVRAIPRPPDPDEKKESLKLMIRAAELVESGRTPDPDEDPEVLSRMETYREYGGVLEEMMREGKVHLETPPIVEECVSELVEEGYLDPQPPEYGDEKAP